VAQHLQAFCMLLPPITITLLSPHRCCPIEVIQLPSSNCRRCCHQHTAISGSNSIIAIAITIAVAAIAIIVIIIDVALLMSSK
jgi:hypothetical protein